MRGADRAGAILAVGDDGDTNLGDLVADSDAPSPEEIVLTGLHDAAEALG